MSTRAPLQPDSSGVHHGRWGRVAAVVPLLAITFLSTACGGDDDADERTSTTPPPAATTGPSEPEPTAPGTTEPGSDTEEPRPEDPGAPPAPPDPSTIPEAVAPNGLGTVELPDAADGVVELFAALPGELFGGRLELDNLAPGRIAASYPVADRRCSEIGFQAFDLTASDGGFPPEWRAENFVALFASGADWDVEDAGQDGDRYWVTFVTTCGGEDIEQDEVIASAVWGDGGSPWVYTVAGPDASGRSELLTAFVDAASQVTHDDDAPPSADQSAAEAALLTVDDLGDDWVALPRLPSDDDGFDEVGTQVLAEEPVCADTLAAAEDRGVSVFELIESLVQEPLTRAESPTFTSRRDGQSEIEHSISVFATGDEVAAALAAVRDAGWLGCVIAAMDDLMTASFLEEGIEASVTDYVATERDLGLGDDSLAAAFEIDLRTADGSEIRFRLDLSVVVLGRATSAVTVFASTDAIDDATIDELIGVAADRVADIDG